MTAARCARSVGLSILLATACDDGQEPEESARALQPEQVASRAANTPAHRAPGEIPDDAGLGDEVPWEGGDLARVDLPPGRAAILKLKRVPLDGKAASELAIRVATAVFDQEAWIASPNDPGVREWRDSISTSHDGRYSWIVGRPFSGNQDVLVRYQMGSGALKVARMGAATATSAGGPSTEDGEEIAARARRAAQACLDRLEGRKAVPTGYYARTPIHERAQKRGRRGEVETHSTTFTFAAAMSEFAVRDSDLLVAVAPDGRCTRVNLRPLEIVVVDEVEVVLGADEALEEIRRQLEERYEEATEVNISNAGLGYFMDPREDAQVVRPSMLAQATALLENEDGAPFVTRPIIVALDVTVPGAKIVVHRYE